MGNQRQSARNRLSGDQRVMGSNRSFRGSQRGANAACLTGVFTVEIQNFEPQRFDPGEVFRGSPTFVCSVV